MFFAEGEILYCIAGADGFFGAYIQRFLIGHGESVLALNHRSAVFPESENVKNLPFELTSRKDLDALHALLKNERDIKIIYLIAAHSPDFVKAQPEKARHINSRAYKDLLTKLSDCDITQLYYASSDTVYGENKDDTPFTEASPLSPVNLYGEHKIRAEEITLGCGFSVARFPYMFAPSLTYKKHFFDTLTDKLSGGESIYMFTDYIRSSLTYPVAAEYLCRLLNADTDEKIFNICADEPTSKYDIGLYAAKTCGADEKLVVPCKSADSGVFTERRAGLLTMSNAKLKAVLGITERIGF